MALNANILGQRIICYSDEQHPPPNKPNWKNRTLFHHDNLDVLRGMDSETVDLITIDPPFNKGKDFPSTTPSALAKGKGGGSFQDRWRWDDDVHQDWVDDLKDDNPRVLNVIEGSRLSYGDDMGAYLCFMAVRLLAMHRVLREDGSIYLHCDTTASHYLKQLMDAIFGKDNFRNEIIWRIGWVSGYKTQKRGWIRNHETIFYYLKSPEAKGKFNKEYIPYADGYRRRDGKLPTGKGIAMEDTWNCHSGDILDSIMIKSFSKEKTGYPTQKPLALLDRIIKASSNKGDVVLDAFCGCATALVSAERLDRQWVGIDTWDEAHEEVIKRLEKEGLATPKGKSNKQQGSLIDFGEIHYETKPPERTDGEETASLPLRVKVVEPEPPGRKMSRDEMYDHLINNQNERKQCQGCDREFDDVRYLEIDHNTPRSDGGINHISNRVLLCSPCNKLKSNTFTLSGLRKENKKRGYAPDGFVP